MTTRFKLVTGHDRKPTLRETHESLDEAVGRAKLFAEGGYSVMIYREDVSLVGEYYPSTKPAGLPDA